MCVGQTSSVDSRSINAFSIRTDKEMFQKRQPSIFLIDPCLFFGLSWISKNHWALLRANLSIMQGFCVCLGDNRGARGGDLIQHIPEFQFLGDVRLMSLREMCRGPVEEIWFQRHVQRGHITINTFQSFNGCPSVWRESREGLWRLGLGEWGDYIHILARHNHCQSSRFAIPNTNTKIKYSQKVIFIPKHMTNNVLFTLCVISHKDALLHSLYWNC